LNVWWLYITQFYFVCVVYWMYICGTFMYIYNVYIHIYFHWNYTSTYIFNFHLGITGWEVFSLSIKWYENFSRPVGTRWWSIFDTPLPAATVGLASHEEITFCTIIRYIADGQIEDLGILKCNGIPMFIH